MTELLGEEQLRSAVRRAPSAAAAGDVLTAAHPVASLQRTAGNAAVAAELQRDEDERSPVLSVVGRGGGRPLPAEVRGEMEGALGADFSGVRIHDDSAAQASAAAVGAHAYTTGHEIVFGAGAFDPGSTDGKRTLAHELTHVVQQSNGPVDGTPTGDGVSVSDPGDRFEREAAATAEQVVSDGAGSSAGAAVHAPAAAGSAVQRHEDHSPGDGHDHDVQLLALQRDDAPKDEDEEPVQALALQREAAPDDDEEPAPA